LRNLVLVAPTLASPVFIGVSIFRLVLTDPFFYWFGRKYGDVAIRWMQDKLGPGASIVLWLEKFFGKASYVAVAAVPNQWICLLAGATRMRIWVFVTLNVGGTVARVMLIWWLGETFSDPILSLNSWITDHRLVLTGVTFAIVGFAMWRAYRKGENQLITADELADELEDARDETLADEAN
jgi:membrane protein DedA with SNARE-associated domain